MLNMLLSENVRISRLKNAVAAGTSNQTGTTVDMAADGGYDGCLFLALLGTLTASQVTQMKLTQSSDDGVADGYSDIAGSKTDAMADADSNKLIAIDIKRPTKQYLQPILMRATANAVLD